MTYKLSKIFLLYDILEAIVNNLSMNLRLLLIRDHRGVEKPDGYQEVLQNTGN